MKRWHYAMHPKKNIDARKLGDKLTMFDYGTKLN